MKLNSKDRAGIVAALNVGASVETDQAMVQKDYGARPFVVVPKNGRPKIRAISPVMAATILASL